MRFNLRITGILLIILLPSFLSGKSTSQWTNFLYQNDVKKIFVHEEKLWLATTGGILVRTLQGEIDTTFSTADGLARNYVNDIVVDNDNNIWFATEGEGVSKYDGLIWTTYTKADGLVSDYVKVSAVDKQGNLWFAGAFGNVSRYDGNSWTTYNHSNGLINPHVKSIGVAPNGDIWFGTTNGLSQFDGSSFEHFDLGDSLMSNTIYSIAFESDGTAWFASFADGIIRFDGSSWDNITTLDGLPSNSVQKIHIDEDDKVFVATLYDGIVIFDGEAWQICNSDNGLPADKVTDITTDSNGNLWLSLVHQGVCMRDGTGWVQYQTANTISYNRISALTIDSFGKLWAGGHTECGIDVFDNQQWVNHSLDLKIPQEILDVKEDHEGNIWVLPESDRLVWHDGSNWIPFSTHEGLLGYLRSFTIDDQGNFWFAYNGTTHGIHRWDGETWIQYTEEDGLWSNWVVNMETDWEGNLWLAHMYGGITKFDGNSFTNYLTETGLLHGKVKKIAVDNVNQEVWFATAGGIVKFDGSQWTCFNTSNGLPSENFNVVTVDASGNKWFGSSNDGLVKFDGTAFTTYDIQDGLVDNFIQSLTCDSLGNLWVGTDAGLSRFSPLYQLNVNAEPQSGGVAEGTGSFLAGDSLQISAIAHEGYHFVEWSGDIQFIDDLLSSEINLVMPAAEVNLTAHFALTEFELILTSGNEDAGSVSGGGFYHMGDSIIVKATPASGYIFDTWSGDIQYIIDDHQLSVCELIMPAENISLTAHFMVPGNVAANDVFPVKVYPNPASNKIFAGFFSCGSSRISLYDLHGKLIHYVDIEESGEIVVSLDIENLSPGLYLVKITSADDTAAELIQVR